MVFLLLLAFALVLVGVLRATTERGSARPWSYTEIGLLAVCVPLVVLGWSVLSGAGATTAKAVGVAGLWLLLFARFSQLLLAVPTGDHTVGSVLAEIEDVFAAAGDHESAGTVREHRERLEGARTDAEAAGALLAIEGLAQPGNGRFSDRLVGSHAGNARLSTLWPVLGALARRGQPRPRI
ncbi:hypothetical protein ACVU7I_01170 [Patulibacter sp. S7RM1-6]